MTHNDFIRIFIDNTGIEEDKEFGRILKLRISNLKLDIPLLVQTFDDLSETDSYEYDPNNEANTLKAINKANIVIPVISSFYLSYVTPKIEEAINVVIDSSERYLFPVLLSEAEWSNYDWIVKTRVTPLDATPFSSYSKSESEKIINELIKRIKDTILNIYSGTTLGKPEIAAKLLRKDNIVFISHDHDDADFAELLKLKLEKEGIESWLDTERLKIGQDWREEIDQGIANSVAVIAIMTPEARKSEYVTYEWAFAWGKGKKIFPLMLKQTQLHPRLESLQYLNFTNNPARPWDELIESIKRAIKK